MATAVEFDFATRQERTIPADQARLSCEMGLFCWVDVDACADRAGAEKILRELGVNEHAIEQAIGLDVDGRHDLYDDCLHIAVTSTAFGDGRLTHSHVDIIISERFLVTLRRGTVDFIEQVRRHYRQDFLKFAKTSSFLLYEYWDSLIDSYRKTLQAAEDHVETLQAQIFADADDQIFNEVSRVTRDLLLFRKIMVAAREVIHELSSRISPFVAESAQPFLDKLAGTLERLSSDLAVEREILSETLNLYMGIVSHRTNKVVNRLTVLSMIFLPLTFLCGVYGMNFDAEKMMPELSWEYGYRAFWLACIAISGSLLIFMKRRRWI